MVAFVVNHLWQSTLFAAGAALLAHLLRHNAAKLRYALWLTASLKFLIPFALLTALAACRTETFN
jgi:bla regulator protein BlaR1